MLACLMKVWSRFLMLGICCCSLDVCQLRIVRAIEEKYFFKAHSLHLFKVFIVCVCAQAHVAMIMRPINVLF